MSDSKTPLTDSINSMICDVASWISKKQSIWKHLFFSFEFLNFATQIQQLQYLVLSISICFWIQPNTSPGCHRDSTSYEWWQVHLVEGSPRNCPIDQGNKCSFAHGWCSTLRSLASFSRTGSRTGNSLRPFWFDLHVMVSWFDFMKLSYLLITFQWVNSVNCIIQTYWSIHLYR